jgi:hypothetical protein
VTLFRTRPAEPVEAGWYTYVFETRLRCALGCPPGAHPLYIGKTNRPWARVLEHAKTQPWFPYACGYHIDEAAYVRERDSLAAETAKIRGRLPLANKRHNERNPHRLHFAGSPSGFATSRRPVRRPRFVVRAHPGWLRVRRRVAMFAGLWAAFAILVLVASFAVTLPLTVAQRMGGAGVAGMSLTLLSWRLVLPKQSPARAAFLLFAAGGFVFVLGPWALSLLRTLAS